MSASASIRQATPHDEDSVLALMEGFCLSEGKTFQRDQAQTGLSPLLESDTHGVVLVAESESVLVGYAVVCWSWSVEIGGAEACLDEIYVSSRDKGIGSALIGAAREVCVAHGMRRIFLETEAINDDARRLYERHGFKAEDSIWMALTL